jgi:dTDP-4-dehydrorhamnose 3,5-epimerase|tara:strand:- start:1608 stop:2171 length:564 start_codon:yes stop_codon:yes gene_type:complete
MEITKTELFKDVLVFEPQVFNDDRGFFYESYNTEKTKLFGFNEKFVQDNRSMSHKYVVRGLHYQWDDPMGKLVSVTQGRIYDLIVDVRKDSKTLGKTFGIILSSENKKQLWVPPGYAHGFISLTDNTHVSYKCSNVYNSEGEGGISPLEDYALEHWYKFVKNIDQLILSEKDMNAQTFAEYLEDPKF